MAHAARPAARRRQRLEGRGAAARYRKAPGGGVPGLPFRIGQSVVHAKFARASSSMPRAAARCARADQFRPQGMKWLQLEYAKLQAA